MSSKEFNRFQAFFWPVHRWELRKVVPMLLIFFLICFNYNVLRAAKDALVVTAPHSGAEAIPFIKVWAILPAVFLMTFLYTRICNKLNREKVFYTLTTIFLAFFFLFAFVLYPMRESLHPHEFCDRLQESLPLGFRGFIAIFRNWTYTAFYIMAEMWSTIMMSVLFWGFANEVTSVKDAKRHYGLFAISANFSGIIAGKISSVLSGKTFRPYIPFGEDAWGQSIILISSLVIICGFLCMILFRWLHVQGEGYNSESIRAEEKIMPKIKMGMRKNFAYLAKSNYLILIAVIVIMYNISINLVEVVWKDQLKLLYPDPSDYTAYMGKILMWIGIISTFTSMFISGNVIRRFNWTASAMIAPLILAVTGIFFFTFMLLHNTSLSSVTALIGSTPLAIGVFFGSLQNIMARASKYTLFDATKELAFVPLDKESKLKGKTAIDGVGSRLGKSGGSIIHQGLLMCFGTVAQSTPYVGLLLIGTIGSWIIAVRALGHRFNALIAAPETAQQEQSVEVAKSTEEHHVTSV